MITITNTDRGLRGDSLAWVPTTEHEAATNAGSLLLWGSSAYPRMDRADAFRSVGYVPRADSRRMLVVGAGLSAEMPSGRRVAYRQLNSADGSVTLRDSVAF